MNQIPPGNKLGRGLAISVGFIPGGLNKGRE